MGLNPHGGDHRKPNGSIVDFSVNVHPLGFPEELRDVLHEQIQFLPFYPSIDGCDASNAIAQHLGLKPAEVITGNGAIELIYLYARVHNDAPVCIIGPTFNEYERAFRRAGARVLKFQLREEDQFQLSLEKFRAFLDENPDCRTVVVCHPNNPTGEGVINIAEFMELIGDRSLLVDESFIEFTNLPSFLPWIRKANLFVVRSMTKFYALAGLRIGYGCSSEGTIRQLTDDKEPWSMNAFALASVPVLLQANEYQTKVKTWVQMQKKSIIELLEKETTWVTFPGQANFFLVKFPFSLIPVREKLLQQGIYFRVCTDFQGLGENFGRFTVLDQKQAVKLIQKIKEANHET